MFEVLCGSWEKMPCLLLSYSMVTLPFGHPHHENQRPVIEQNDSRKQAAQRVREVGESESWAEKRRRGVATDVRMQVRGARRGDLSLTASPTGLGKKPESQQVLQRHHSIQRHFVTTVMRCHRN